MFHQPGKNISSSLDDQEDNQDNILWDSLGDLGDASFSNWNYEDISLDDFTGIPFDPSIFNDLEAISTPLEDNSENNSEINLDNLFSTNDNISSNAPATNKKRKRTNKRSADKSKYYKCLNGSPLPPNSTITNEGKLSFATFIQNGESVTVPAISVSAFYDQTFVHLDGASLPPDAIVVEASSKKYVATFNHNDKQITVPVITKSNWRKRKELDNVPQEKLEQKKAELRRKKAEYKKRIAELRPEKLMFLDGNVVPSEAVIRKDGKNRFAKLNSEEDEVQVFTEKEYSQNHFVFPNRSPAIPIAKILRVGNQYFSSLNSNGEEIAERVFSTYELKQKCFWFANGFPVPSNAKTHSQKNGHCYSSVNEKGESKTVQVFKNRTLENRFEQRNANSLNVLNCLMGSPFVFFNQNTGPATPINPPSNSYHAGFMTRPIFSVTQNVSQVSSTPVIPVSASTITNLNTSPLLFNKNVSNPSSKIVEGHQLIQLTFSKSSIK